MNKTVLLVICFLLVACQQDSPATPTVMVPAGTTTLAPTPLALASPVPPTRAPTPNLTPSLPPSPTPTITITPSPTPDPYAGLSIAELATRSYGGGQLEIVDTLEENEIFARYLIRYPSDGLMIYGFLSVPNEGSKFPVAIIAHGYIDPDVYEVEAYTTRYANALSEAGFFVIHPNFRNYPPSDGGENPYRIGYAIDLLNLIAIVREQSQLTTGPLRRADGQNIHLMGHSMGGGAVLRVITVWPEAAKAAVLYGSMSGDEAQNYAKVLEWSGGNTGRFEVNASSLTLQAISPIYHLERIQTAISIHHSTDDTVVPAGWSDQLCQQLQALSKPVECFTYHNTPHTFNGPSDALFIQRMIAFFGNY